MSSEITETNVGNLGTVQGVVVSAVFELGMSIVLESLSS